MSKERARRRAEREREAAARAAAGARAAAAERRRRHRAARLAALVPRRRGRPDGLLDRRRRAQNSTVALLFVLGQALAWLVFRSAEVSAAVLVFSVLAVPVLVTLVLDRRGS